MKKKVVGISIIVLLVIILFLSNKLLKNNISPTLAITIDGESVTSIPSTGHYDLTSYTCDNGSTIMWDKINHNINFTSSVSTSNESCVLNFTTSSTFLLNTVNIGDYVLYEGSNGCTNTSNTSLDTVYNSQCKGMNANYVSSSSMGYCYSSNYKFYTTGWRIAYLLDSDSDSILEPYIVSAGSPSCVTSTDSDSSATITSLNTEAIKYCNPNYAYGGGCQSTYNTAGTNYNTWALKGLDFYQITLQLLGEGRRLYSYDTATESSTGTTCYVQYSTKACGYNNDLIDNGEWYWFGSASSSPRTLLWYPHYRSVNGYSSSAAYGGRSVVHLKSSIYVSTGSGTQSDPYIIGY